MTVEKFFAENRKMALAFSGGVDSAYLLYAARSAGCDVHAYFVKSPFQPRFELEDAQRLARQLDIPLTVAELDILALPQAAENGPRRCYYCKRAIFSRLWELARADGYSLLADGTNASDDQGDRPGMQALAELGVRSPLRECGLDKARIRALSREAGLFTSGKPAYACLATRIPAGTPITPQLLAQTEQGEALLERMGFWDFRLRYFHGAARLQLPAGQLARALECRAELEQSLREMGYGEVLLDLRPRETGHGEVLP